MMGRNITRDQTLSSSENDYTLQADHDQEEQCFIQKSSSCPIPYLRVSRWNVAKVQVKQKVLSAAKKMNIRSPSMNKTSSGSRSKPIQDDDGRPVVLVGPVIGLVTTSTARILLEIDKTEEIQMILQPLIIDSPDHSHLRPSENLSISQRHSTGSNFHCSNTMEGCSKFSTIWRGASSKTNLSKEPYNFIAAEETDNMPMVHDHLLELASEDNTIMSPLVLMNGQHEYNSITNKEKRSRGLKLWKRRNSTLHRALLSDSPFIGTADIHTETDQLYNRGPHPVSSRKSSGSPRPRKETSFNIVSKRLRKASLYKPLSMESENIYRTGQQEKPEQDSIVLTKKLEAKRPCVFEFTGLQPETRYMVKLAGCHEAVKNSNFRTFPEKPSKCFRMAAISCNSIFITKKTITNISDLWSHLFKSIKEGRIDLVIHLGDQVSLIAPYISG